MTTIVADLSHAIRVASKYDSSTGHGISLISLKMPEPEPKRTKRGKSPDTYAKRKQAEAQ